MHIRKKIKTYISSFTNCKETFFVNTDVDIGNFNSFSWIVIAKSLLLYSGNESRQRNRHNTQECKEWVQVFGSHLLLGCFRYLWLVAFWALLVWF